MPSETENQDQSHTAASLALPAVATAGTSEAPSRADTLIEGDGSDRRSQDTNKKGQEAATGKTEALHPSGRPTSATKSEKMDTSQEKGARFTDDEKRAAEAVTTTAEANDQNIVAAGEDDSDRYLTGFKLFLVFVGLLLSIFLVALDQTIVATALPAIASKFNALQDLTWIVSAYFFTQTGLILTYGQLLTIVDTKLLYLFVITVFEIGSLFCAVAWNMEFLIFGRAVAGVGAAGIFTSILTIIARVTRLQDRPALFGAFGAVFAVSSVAGPLLGGAFTDHVSWRWCFYINLPFGALSILAVIFFLKAQPTIELPGNEGKTKLQKWIGIDWIGTLLCLCMIMPLMLGLQWGGNLYPWNNKIIIALFCTFAVVLPIFVGWQYKLGPRAVMPLWMYQRKTQIGTAILAGLIMINLTVATYYLPFYYQASRGRTPTQSGIDILPFMLTIILSAAISGGIVNVTGSYIWFLRIGPLFSAIGGGLLYTIDLETSNAKLIGYQIIMGLGVGLALQNAVIAIQAEWADRDELIPQATSIVTFFQLFGGVLGIAIAGAVFSTCFHDGIEKYAPGLDPQLIEAIRGTLSVVATLPQEVQRQVVEAYVEALNYVFIVVIPVAILASLSALLIAPHNVKKRGVQVGMAH